MAKRGGVLTGHIPMLVTYGRIPYEHQLSKFMGGGGGVHVDVW